MDLKDKRKIKKLIEKTNNIEKNIGTIKRHFFLGGKKWFIGRTFLWLNGKKTNEEEQEEFIRLKEEFEKIKKKLK